MNKNIKYIIPLLLIISVSGYFLYQHSVEYGLSKPALILKISTNLTEDGRHRINNVTFEKSSIVFFYKGADTIPSFPTVEANARLNRLDAAPASFWASTPFNFDEDEGNYELKIYFKEGNEPKKGDVLILPIRIVGHTGIPMYKTTSFYLWD